MKANKLKYIALSGAFMLLTAFATISCDDANDWTTDSSYNRLFSVPKMSVSANATDALPLQELNIILLKSVWIVYTMM